MAYPMAEYRNNQKEYENFYDNIELCEASANAHPKATIQIRNRKMIDRSDLVICYIDHKSGGAYQSVEYAMHTNKMVINLNEAIKKDNKVWYFIVLKTLIIAVIYFIILYNCTTNSLICQEIVAQNL